MNETEESTKGEGREGNGAGGVHWWIVRALRDSMFQMRGAQRVAKCLLNRRACALVFFKSISALYGSNGPLPEAGDVDNAPGGVH